MSFQERRAIVSFISTILINVVYAAVMIQRYPLGDAYSGEVFRFWGAFFLILVPVTIIAKILVHIAFSILNTIATQEYEEEMTDERDRMIDLNANRSIPYILGVGFLVAMGSLAIGMPPAAMFIILLCAGVVSELVSAVWQFYFYRRGF